MAVKAPVTCADLSARIVALEANLAALRQVLDERDARYAQRAASQDKAVSSALETSEKAIIKAESATERRFEGVNEFRQTLADQASTLMPRAEYTVQHDALRAQVAGIDRHVSKLQSDQLSLSARGGGMKETWGYVIAVIGLIIAMLAVYFRAAHAHDSEQWIAKKLLRDPISGQFCCGPADCRALEDGDVKEVTGGFAVHMSTYPEMPDIDEVIPYSRAMPFAPDGRYHACLGWNYPNIPKIRCLIIPPGST